ncbi:4-amino-4-deoxy-L-arabinose transferase [Modestobacter sp. DSM 44400]|uniref:glycosyltransferase family 39 protein n=1 Tax=Modestobacter sp. DSM 44400 TaxID=1550230 RepID=UPI00089AAAFD|nr:glycosyltransferase family 39 protein [Modestobacter sp. DSM 44400]SDY49888.1 4-amino-4-deoxy-L-arabinose transferase [Modestobacter sp. DSM 44400]
MNALRADRRPRARRSLLETVRGRRGALAGLLVVAGLLYSLGLSASGWANAYYSAAAQAGALNWRAMLFGGLDPSGGITVDKPPAFLWLPALSVRLFGLTTQSLLLPQAAFGVASVALLYGTVRRQALGIVSGSPRADERGPSHEARAAAVGLFAAAALAVTPVVTLMARYDNPDALMVTLSVGAAYALVRSVAASRGGGVWLALAGALLGLAFLTKLLQAWLVLPAFVAVALVAGAGTIGRRLARVLGAAAAMVAAAGWWVLLVQLTPAADRPWIGGSQHNSVVELALGYNGLGRVTGQEGGGGAADVARPANWFRLFGSWTPEAGWLLPAALAALVSGWVLTRGRDRRDPVRAGLLLWGGWLLGAGVVLSSLRGISHSYYAVQLAPAIAGSVALGGALLWQRAWSPGGAAWARWVLAVGVVVSAAWSTGLLVSRPAWPLSTAPLALIAAAVAVLGISRAGARWTRRLVSVAAVAALLVGPATWSVATASSVHRGANVASGPGVTQAYTPAEFSQDSATNTRLPLTVVDTVRSGSAGYDWVAAVAGRRAADLQLASGAPVWSLGGFNGRDPHPTLDEFVVAVADRRVHYLVLDGPARAGSTPADQIGRWASQRVPVQRMGRWFLFDLSGLAGAGASGGSPPAPLDGASAARADAVPAPRSLSTPSTGETYTTVMKGRAPCSSTHPPTS